MILRAFLPVISSLLLLHGSSVCPDDYAPNSFEEAGDETKDLIDEYFTQKNIPFLPRMADIKKLKLSPSGKNFYIYPGSLLKSGRRFYPFKTGIWKIETPSSEITVTHLLVKEYYPLAETEAFNNYNELLGDGFADYDNRAYVMQMKPDEIRMHFKNRYFGLSVNIYGVQDDATELNTTVADIIFTDYSIWVEKYKKCKGKR